MKASSALFFIAAAAGVSGLVLPEVRLSNAERFARGLGPKAPSRRFDASRTGARRATASATPISGVSVCKAPSTYPLSCSSEANGSGDTCCNTYPGGHLLLTQFWDTGSTSTGPSDSWTIHGLWPDNCDGSYEQYCSPERELSNITAVLQAKGQQDTLDYMNTFWKDYQGNDETFWEHEFNKHATCISSLNPECFSNFAPQDDAVYFFRRAVELQKTLPSYEWLTAAGIVPSTTQTYTLKQIQDALGVHYSGGININCANKNILDELWYHYSSQGSVIDGSFVPAPLVGSASTCPSTGIYWYPKYTTIPAQGGGTTTPGTGTGNKGFIYAVSADGTISDKTCVISGGTWYHGGTCATFTLTNSVAGTTLLSSKGTCGVEAASNTASPNLFDCPTGGSAVDFTVDFTTGSNQVKIYKDSNHALPLTLKFVASA